MTPQEQYGFLEDALFDTIEYTDAETKRYGRHKWPDGPWSSEPWDKIVWKDTHTGLRCVMLRNQIGAWCGYVGVDVWHPWHGVRYRECTEGHPSVTQAEVIANLERELAETTDPQARKLWEGTINLVKAHYEPRGSCEEHSPEQLLRVHGSITYSGDLNKRIDDNDSHYYYGFDCAHAWDIAPGRLAMEQEMGFTPLTRDGSEYRDIAFVKTEVESLAQQLFEHYQKEQTYP